MATKHAKKKRAQLSREGIAAAALALADRQGFEAVSMRNLADALGVGTMTLYHYVKTKDDLVALMDDALLSKMSIAEPLPKDWRAALTLIAFRTRDVFLHHKWALLSTRGTLPGPNSMLHFEQSLAALAHTKLDWQTKLHVLALVDDFVNGHILRAAEISEVSERSAGAESKHYEKDARASIATGPFPQIRAVFHGVDEKESVKELGDSDARFRAGLAMLLDGVALRVRKR